MPYINPNEQTRKENYKMLSGCVIPRPIAFITTKNGEGIVNAAPFSFFNVLTAQPPLIGVSVGRRNGEVTKHTAKNILESKEFVVHIVDESFLEQVNQSAAEYPSDVSEVEETNLQLVESKKITTPGIQEAKIRMECVLNQVVTLGDEEEQTSDLIIGEVVMVYADEKVYEDGNILVDQLDPIGRLAGANYSKLGETITLTRK